MFNYKYRFFTIGYLHVNTKQNIFSTQESLLKFLMLNYILIDGNKIFYLPKGILFPIPEQQNNFAHDETE